MKSCSWKDRERFSIQIIKPWLLVAGGLLLKKPFGDYFSDVDSNDSSTDEKEIDVGISDQSSCSTSDDEPEVDIPERLSQ